MPYNEDIEIRLMEIISPWEETDHRKMFGGVCHLLRGNMFCGVYKDFLIVRLGEKGADQAFTSPFVRPFDISGRPMRGWVMIEQPGFRTMPELKDWLDQAREFALSLPPK